MNDFEIGKHYFSRTSFNPVKACEIIEWNPAFGLVTFSTRETKGQCVMTLSKDEFVVFFQTYPYDGAIL